MRNISEDLSKLTTISEDDIAKFFRYITYCCGDAVLEDLLQDVEISEIDLGIGTLYIKHATDDAIAYKFIPSTQFQSVIKTSVHKKTSPISKIASKAARKNFMQAYKNLC